MTIQNPTPAQVLAVGDAWDDMAKEARYAVIVLSGQIGVLGPSLPWVEMPATSRLELVHRVYLFRDLLNRVLP